MDKPASLQAFSAHKLDLSPGVEAALTDVRAELADAYRASFVAMMDAIGKQASALARVQNTLNILVEHIAPKLNGQIPPAIGIVEHEPDSDIARALVVADPIAMGYTLSKASLAQAIGISAADLSVLTKAFKLDDNDRCAVVVREGKRHHIVNYHRRAIERFIELVATPPKGLDRNQLSALERVRARLAGKQRGIL